MFKLVPSFLLCVFLVLVAVPASAFTPNNEELNQAIRKNYGPLSSWEAEMSFPEYPGVVAHLWYARGKWRQEWKAGDTAKAVGINDSVVASCTPGDFAQSPMFVWMVPNPVETWIGWGVDNATSVFGFCEDTPCYMLGAEPDDATSPAVFLNNEDMSPLQIRYVSESGLTTLQYSDYKTLGGFRVPQKVTMTFGSDSVLKADVKWIAVNRADDEMLYARDALDSAPCATPPAPFDILLKSFRYPEAK